MAGFTSLVGRRPSRDAAGVDRGLRLVDWQKVQNTLVNESLDCEELRVKWCGLALFVWCLFRVFVLVGESSLSGLKTPAAVVASMN